MVLLKSVQKTKEGLIGLCEDGETVKLNPADRCGSLKSDKGENFRASFLKELENDSSAYFKITSKRKKFVDYTVYFKKN